MSLRFAGFSAFSRNPLHLLFQLGLPHQGGIEIVCLVDAYLRPDEFVLDQMPQEHFQRLPVLLIHGEQEKGQHHQDHAQRRRGSSQARLCQKEKRHAYQRRRSETDHLSFGQPEQDLALYPTQVLRDCYISQCFTPPSSSAHSP